MEVVEDDDQWRLLASLAQERYHRFKQPEARTRGVIHCKTQ
jgi:hypothetical protein